MQLITIQNFNIKNYFNQFLWFFSLTCWFKGQIIFRIHLSLPNSYNWCVLIEISMEIGNWDVKFLECDYLLVQRCVKLTLAGSRSAVWCLPSCHVPHSTKYIPYKLSSFVVICCADTQACPWLGIGCYFFTFFIDPFSFSFLLNMYPHFTPVIIFASKRRIV